jgi:hypothetical protein
MLLMNHPSTIRPSEKAEILVNSSTTAWLSQDGNDRWDEGEPLGPFPILTIESYGKGKLMVLSEPSLLINDMNKPTRMDNSVFVNNLVDYMTEGRETTIIDESHRDLTDPVQISNSFVSVVDRTEEKIALLMLVSVIFIFLNTSYPRKFLEILMNGVRRILAEKPSEGSDEEGIVEIVMKRNPGWDKRVLERLVKDIEGRP